MLEEIARCAGRGDSFAFETTLAGRTYLPLIRLWQALAYSVSLYFLSLPTPDMAVARVAGRVRQGGHDVPERVVHRRFAAGLENFHRRYKLVVDNWALYDNSDRQPVLLDWGEKSAR